MGASRRLAGAAGLALLMLALAGCAAVGPPAEPPRLTLAGITLQNMTLLEQEYRLTLRVQNPNDHAIRIRGISFDLEINDRPFATGISNRRLEIAGYDSATVDVVATSTLVDLMRRITELGDQARLQYRLKGHLRLEGLSGTLPFDRQGEVLPGLSRPPPDEPGTRI